MTSMCSLMSAIVYNSLDNHCDAASRSSRQSLLGFDIDQGFGELGERGSGRFLFVECRLQKPGGVGHSEFFGPGTKRTIARHLVVLDRLSGREKARVERRHSLEVLHDLRTFFRDAVDGGAGFSARRLADDLEDLIEAFHLAFRLPEMFREGLLQLL